MSHRRKKIGLLVLAALFVSAGAVVFTAFARGRFPPPVDRSEFPTQSEMSTRHGHLHWIGVADRGKATISIADSASREIIVDPDGRRVDLERLSRRRPAYLVDGGGQFPRFSGATWALSPSRIMAIRTRVPRVDAEVYSIPSGEPLWARTVESVLRARMSEDGRRLLMVHVDSFVLWDIEEDRLLLSEAADPDNLVTDLSPDGRWLVHGPANTDGGAWVGTIVDLDTGNVAHEPSCRGLLEVDRFPERPDRIPVGGIRFDHPGRLFAFAEPWRAKVYLMDLVSGESREVPGFLLDPVGTRLAIWDPATRTVRAAGPGPGLSDPVELRGELIASRAARGAPWLALHVRSTARPTLLERLLGPNPPQHALVVVDLETAEIVLSRPIVPPLTVGFSPTGVTLAVQDYKALHLYNR